MKYITYVITFGLAMLVGCSGKNKYDVTSYYDAKEKEEVLTTIVNYIFMAPPYTAMKDRFQEKHRAFYQKSLHQFSLVKYYIADDGTHYFYLTRPGVDGKEKRGVGGHFKMIDKTHLTDFREAFVTPSLPEDEVRGRCAFLFDEMVKDSLDQYLTMDTYVQWPNPISYYDTLTYEWKLKSDLQ